MSPHMHFARSLVALANRQQRIAAGPAMFSAELRRSRSLTGGQIRIENWLEAALV
jgi:hypothetical protein